MIGFDQIVTTTLWWFSCCNNNNKIVIFPQQFSSYCQNENYEDISSDTLSRGIEGIEAIEQIGYEIGNIFKKDHKPK